jgi:predicted PurR-regulated permease PerM
MPPKTIELIKSYFNVIGWMFAIAFVMFALLAIFSPSRNFLVGMMLLGWAIMAFPPVYRRFTKSHGLIPNIVARIAGIPVSLALVAVLASVMGQKPTNIESESSRSINLQIQKPASIYPQSDNHRQV